MVSTPKWRGRSGTCHLHFGLVPALGHVQMTSIYSEIHICMTPPCHVSPKSFPTHSSRHERPSARTPAPQGFSRKRIRRVSVASPCCVTSCSCVDTCSAYFLAVLRGGPSKPDSKSQRFRVQPLPGQIHQTTASKPKPNSAFGPPLQSILVGEPSPKKETIKGHLAGGPSKGFGPLQAFCSSGRLLGGVLQQRPVVDNGEAAGGPGQRLDAVEDVEVLLALAKAGSGACFLHVLFCLLFCFCLVLLLFVCLLVFFFLGGGCFSGGGQKLSLDMWTKKTAAG